MAFAVFSHCETKIFEIMKIILFKGTTIFEFGVTTENSIFINCDSENYSRGGAHSAPAHTAAATSETLSKARTLVM